MPVYYFHLYNDERLLDPHGKTLPDDAAARQAAVEGISELIAENIVEGRPVELTDRIEVADEAGRIVTTVRFSDLFVRCGLSLPAL